MNAPQSLHDKGQSLWLDNITRDLLDNGTLKRYIDEWSVTGLTSNPTIFDHAIKNSACVRRVHCRETKERQSPARVCSSSWRWKISLVRRTCFGLSTKRRTAWTDGFPWKCRRFSRMTRRARSLPRRIYLRARIARTCSSRFPVRRKGFPRLKRQSFPACLMNVTLLFSREQYLAAADAFLRGIERRIAAGLNPKVDSVASRVHQPMGCRRRRKSSREAAQQAWHCHREAHVQGRKRSARVRSDGGAPTISARARNVCSWPARERKIRRCRSFCTSRPWLRLTR